MSTKKEWAESLKVGDLVATGVFMSDRRATVIKLTPTQIVVRLDSSKSEIRYNKSTLRRIGTTGQWNINSVSEWTETHQKDYLRNGIVRALGKIDLTTVSVADLESIASILGVEK